MSVATDEMVGTPSTSRGIALIVDDDGTNRIILAGIMRRLGFEAAQVGDGEQAVAFVREQLPTLILMDVMMPRMDGFEATRRIRQITTDQYVPILFLTALDAAEDLSRCIEVGGDDFFPKPYEPSLLEAKLVAMQRNIELHRKVREHRDELANYQGRMHSDMQIAASIFRTIWQRQALASENVRLHLQPVETMNGDLVLGCGAPSGVHHYLLGDFTGHGLPAAFCAMRVADIFYSMCAKGFTISEIIAELNEKLLAVLPADRFFAACLISVDDDGTGLTVWNGGMPDLLVLDTANREVARVTSGNLPLGIVDNSQSDSRVERVAVAPGHRVLAYSDGLIEAHAPDGTMFGEVRLAEVIAAAAPGEDLVSRVLAALDRHLKSRPLHDDVSLLQVTCGVHNQGLDADCARSARSERPSSAWSIQTTLSGPSMRSSDPVPTLVQCVTELQGLEAHRQPLFTILSELYSNALEHGLLGLDSALKSGADGFTRYYELREQRLAALADGSVEVRFRHEPRGPEAGELVIEMSHDGMGFDPSSLPASLPAEPALSGRGIGLIRALSESLTYSPDGRTATVVYRWPVAP